MNIEIYIGVPTGESEWHPVSEKPTTDEVCIVANKTGQVFFEQPYKGVFTSGVKYWMYAPVHPDKIGGLR